MVAVGASFRREAVGQRHLRSLGIDRTVCSARNTRTRKRTERYILLFPSLNPPSILMMDHPSTFHCPPIKSNTNRIDINVSIRAALQLPLLFTILLTLSTLPDMATSALIVSQLAYSNIAPFKPPSDVTSFMREWKAWLRYSAIRLRMLWRAY